MVLHSSQSEMCGNVMQLWRGVAFKAQFNSKTHVSFLPYVSFLRAKSVFLITAFLALSTVMETLQMSEHFTAQEARKNRGELKDWEDWRRQHSSLTRSKWVRSNHMWPVVWPQRNCWIVLFLSANGDDNRIPHREDQVS